MKYYTIESRREVSQEQIDDLLADALEHGIYYWCGEVRIKKGFKPKQKYNYLSEVITRGGVLELYDSEDERWVSLDLHRLLESLGKFNFDWDNYDASDADIIIQQAVFGEVIYG
jgi:hypothetical protein